MFCLDKNNTCGSSRQWYSSVIGTWYAQMPALSHGRRGLCNCLRFKLRSWLAWPAGASPSDGFPTHSAIVLRWSVFCGRDIIIGLPLFSLKGPWTLISTDFSFRSPLWYIPPTKYFHTVNTGASVISRASVIISYFWSVLNAYESQNKTNMSRQNGQGK